MNRMDNIDDHPLIGLNPDKKIENPVNSTPMLAFWNSSLALSEFKILDAYLARIDLTYPEQRWVRFSKGELEELLGIQKINVSDLKKRIDHLGTLIRVEDFDDRGVFRFVALFDEATYHQDDDGMWVVDLRCTASALEYISKFESTEDLRYKLKSIINISSRYSYLLFCYLEQNRFRKEWEVSVEDLRKFLRCTGLSYQNYKYFNRDVLKPCQKELHEKTICHFSYTPVRHGRYIKSVLFRLYPNTKDAYQTFPDVSFPG